MIRIAGVDEAGRGPLAGPVVAAAVVLPDSVVIEGVRDSKKLSPDKRKKLSEIIKKKALDYSIVAVGNRRIDAVNIREASKIAMSLAVRRVDADMVLVDGDMKIDADIQQLTIVGGDNSEPVISAASILAKVYRDWLMELLDKRYPGYLLAKHKGYPTKEHRWILSELGPTKIHRHSFRGVE